MNIKRMNKWLGLPVLIALSGCGKGESASPASEEVGALDVALMVSGLRVDDVKLVIQGETNGVLRERTLSVDDPNATISAREGGLLAGSYEVRLSAHPAEDLPETQEDETKVECEGAVDGIHVEAGKTTEVDDLVLVCTLDGGQVLLTGGIRVRATAVLDAGNLCVDRLIQDAFVGALSTSVGTSVDLAANVAAGATLAWSASMGSVQDASGTNTRFTCPAQAGTAQLTLTAAKGDCSESATVMVECVGTGEAVCGNGVVESGEACDDGNSAVEACAYGTPSCEVCGVGCVSTTVTGPYCGDGVTNGPEQCDGTVGCTVACTVAPPDPICGNNIVEAGEGCDDGNTVTESCEFGTPSCQVCGAGCQLVTATGETATCGNGVLELGEGCDDGNTVTESCEFGTPSCQVCGAGCQSVTATGDTATCGNGVLELGEGCDDGNTVTESCEFGTPSCQVCGTGCQLVDSTGEVSLADQCEACIQAAEDQDFVNFNEQQCNTDPLCVDLKRCLINDTSDPETEGRSCFNYIPATCYCGITTDFAPCETNPSFVATGPCAAETIAAVWDAQTPQEVFQRVTNTDYASGRAYQIVDFARQVCSEACGFTRVF